MSMSNTRIACIGATLAFILTIVIPASPVAGFLAMAAGAVAAVALFGK